MRTPFICHNPKNFNIPVIYSSPHSGRIYLREFLNKTPLNLQAIRASEDFYVDQLLDSVTGTGAFLLEACFPRVFVDLNRSSHELDRKLITNLSTDSISPRTAAGLGVVPRVVGDGVEIYSKKLSLEEVRARLTKCYFPYHKQLQKLINFSIESFGMAFLLDIHSMPHTCLNHLGDKKSRIPQIVLGDCFGTSCTPMFSQEVIDVFTSEGFAVNLNKPFSGGFITKHYGLPKKNVHAIQVEIDRSLYMDEKNVSLHEGFLALKNKIQNIVYSIGKIKEQKKYFFQAAE
mgnify:CR=1 FL=1